VATNRLSPVFARFDRFEVDLSSGELRRDGVAVAIQEQPFQVLRLLMKADGEVVTREQLRAALWPEDTFVDFEHGVNTAVKKLRQALKDSAEEPKFVETLPKVGYRFIVPVEWVAEAHNKSVSQRVVAIAPPGPTPVPTIQAPTPSPGESRGRLQIALVAIGLLILAAAGGYLLRSRPQVKPNELTIIPFTTFPGFEIGPSFSPDGNQIVFAWFGYEKEFQFDLYIKQVGQERTVQLTHHPATFLGAAWSPDSRVIAFMRQAEPDASGIYLISSLGGSERKLANITPFVDWSPIGLSWSADGKWLAFSKSDSSTAQADASNEHFSIHLVNVDTNEERVLPHPSPDCQHTWQPAFSSDGKSLASVCVLTESVATIYVQTPDGKHPREVAGARSSEGFSGIAWSADNQSLLYTSDRQLWRIPLAGGKPEKLLFAQDVESVAVARTGNRLAYAQVRHPGNIWQLELPSEGKAKSPATKLISSSRGDAGAHISPDGKSIAFQSWRSGNPEVWLCDRDASDPVQLTSFEGPPIGEPSWSPDSRRIVFDVRVSGIAQLYVVNVEGGPPKRLNIATPNASNPFWSADGQSIYFTTEPTRAIWKVPADGGRAVRVTGDGGGQLAPQAAADKTRLFFYKQVGGYDHAWSASVEGGDERPVTGMPADVRWVAARNGMYFFTGDSRHYSLSYFDFVTQHARKVVNLPSLFVIWSASLSPDGRTFLFTGIEHSEGDIVLVEGFR
jgi:Tol biopolymer transport system component/DNA-binding winged helix-turn-helix (wHTH) protein